MPPETLAPRWRDDVHCNGDMMFPLMTRQWSFCCWNDAPTESKIMFHFRTRLFFTWWQDTVKLDGTMLFQFTERWCSTWRKFLLHLIFYLAAKSCFTWCWDVVPLDMEMLFHLMMRLYSTWRWYDDPLDSKSCSTWWQVNGPFDGKMMFHLIMRWSSNWQQDVNQHEATTRKKIVNRDVCSRRTNWKKTSTQSMRILTARWPGLASYCPHSSVVTPLVTLLLLGCS